MKLLMVCLGNICRSPLAEGIMKEKAKKHNIEIEVDSAGTAAYHVGEPPDQRSQQIAMKYGIDLSYQRARKFQTEDFDRFNRIFAMDENNFSDIASKARNSKDLEKLDLILNISHPGENKSVPDPYYGGNDGFENVYRMLDVACEAIIHAIKKNNS
jgi:protein-tyrosine phosphatase